MNILTVDLEDWFHVLDNDETLGPDQWLKMPSRIWDETIVLLDLFDKYNLKATFFVLGYIAEKHPELLQEIRMRGHNFASHGTMHQLVYKQTASQFESDITEAKELIYRACGADVYAYRAPGFSITKECAWAFDILAKCGYEIDCSIFPAARIHGGIPDFALDEPCIIETSSGNSLLELPMSKVEFLGFSFVYAGGGYFRLLPWRIVNKIMKNKQYNMTYFHPRDFDPLQPDIPGLSGFRKLKSSVGLKSAVRKLNHLMQENEFICLERAIDRVDWDKVSRIRV